jgi:plastocyanin
MLRRLLQSKLISPGVIALATAACGSDGSAPSAAAPTAPTAAVPTPPPPDPAPPAGPLVTITPLGVTPKELTIEVGGTVAFINDDALPHDIAGGPDPANRDCPEIDVVGFLAPGQQRTTAAFTSARTCEYHDHGLHAHGTAMSGRIVIR